VLVTVPVTGIRETSPRAAQPGPEMWAVLNPLIDESVYAYPPPVGRDGVSGLGCVIPNGIVAPG
jgi:hypothetical protein